MPEPNLTTGIGVELLDCLLSEGLVARDATLPFVTLSGCRLEHPAESPLAAERLTATVPSRHHGDGGMIR